jgi:hypothetical protein
MNTNDKLKLAAEIGVTLPHYTNTDNPIDFPVKGADRTKELARQAGLIAPYGSDREGLRDFDYRKFAELVIKECAEIAADCYTYHEPLSKVPVHIVKFERLTDENMRTKL